MISVFLLMEGWDNFKQRYWPSGAKFLFCAFFFLCEFTRDQKVNHKHIPVSNHKEIFKNVG